MERIMMKKLNNPRGGAQKMMAQPMLPKGPRNHDTHARTMHERMTGPIAGAPGSNVVKHGAASAMGRGAKSNIKGY